MAGWASSLHSLLVQPNHVWVRHGLIDLYRRATQKTRGNVPTLTDVGNDRDRLLVVPGQHPNHERLSIRLKLDSIANSELKHFRVRTHLVEEPQALHNPIVQVDELCLSESIDVDLHVTSSRK